MEIVVGLLMMFMNGLLAGWALHAIVSHAKGRNV